MGWGWPGEVEGEDGEEEDRERCAPAKANSERAVNGPAVGWACDLVAVTDGKLKLGLSSGSTPEERSGPETALIHKIRKEKKLGITRVRAKGEHISGL